MTDDSYFYHYHKNKKSGCFDKIFNSTQINLNTAAQCNNNKIRIYNLINLQFLRRMQMDSLPLHVYGFLESTKRKHSSHVLVCWDPIERKSYLLLDEIQVSKSCGLYTHTFQAFLERFFGAAATSSSSTSSSSSSSSSRSSDS